MNGSNPLKEKFHQGYFRKNVLTIHYKTMSESKQDVLNGFSVRLIFFLELGVK